jgi:hypothetical protein
MKYVIEICIESLDLVSFSQLFSKVLLASTNGDYLNFWTMLKSLYVSFTEIATYDSNPNLFVHPFLHLFKKAAPVWPANLSHRIMHIQCVQPFRKSKCAKHKPILPKLSKAFERLVLEHLSRSLPAPLAFLANTI